MKKTVYIIVRSDSQEHLRQDMKLMRVDGWTANSDIRKRLDPNNHSDWATFVFEVTMFKNFDV